MIIVFITDKLQIYGITYTSDSTKDDQENWTILKNKVNTTWTNNKTAMQPTLLDLQ